jgi:hypothetical protein
MSINELIKVKPYPGSYTNQVLKNIHLLSFGEFKNVAPFGSYIFKAQKYPGDIDLIENYIDCCNIDDVIHKFQIDLINVIHNIDNEILHYMVEFKMGLDKRFMFDFGYLKNGQFYKNLNNIVDKTNQLYQSGLLTQQEINELDGYLKLPDIDSYDHVFNFFREKYVLRWTDKDILNGYKILIGNKKITINEALHDNTHVKIDMITIINNRFVEITNFLMLGVKYNNGDIYLINLNANVKSSLDNFLMKRSEMQLPQEIEKLFYSPYYYNPFKGTKRMWSLARHNKDEKMLKLLVPFISGNISYLYMLKSEVETIINLLIKLKSPTITSIYNQLDEIKARLSYIIELNQQENYFDELFNNLHNLDITELIESLEFIKDLMKKDINHYTIKYLESIGMKDIPLSYLPKQLSYI